MAWSWSHTVQAYADVAENVHNKDREWLEVVFAEWHACKNPQEDSDQFSQYKYNVALKRAKKLPEDMLADYICERMEEYATCTNGGHYAYACPSGCGCHLVSFSHEDTDEERAEREANEQCDREMEAAFADD